MELRYDNQERYCYLACRSRYEFLMNRSGIGQVQGKHLTSHVFASRHALWMHLEDIVANQFAQILAVVEVNNNLDHLSPLSLLSELWLQMFQEESFLRIKYTSK